VREHIRLLAPMFALIAAVWLLRMLLDALGVPHGAVRVFSVTVSSALSLLIAVVLMHLRGFGSYVNVVMASLLLAAWAQFLIVIAIVFSVITGIENIFTEPEFSIPEPDPHHIHHILGHLTYGVGWGTLLGAATGCLLLFLLRLLVPTLPSRQS
jgi:amino acid transporter